MGQTKAGKGRARPGLGGVYQRADGRWEGKIDLGEAPAMGKDGVPLRNDDGTPKLKRDRRSVYGAREADVLEKLDALRARRRDGSLHPDVSPLPTPERTVEAFLGEWLTATKMTLRGKTYEGYESVVRLHIVPTLGSVPVTTLTPADLDALYAAKIDAGLARSTVSKIHRVLRVALAWGVKRKIVPGNVAVDAESPSIPKGNARTLTPVQVVSFLAAARGDSLEALYVLALTTGMRKGELLALKWEHVDLVAGTVRVVQTAQRTKAEGLKAGDPKTESSKRTIKLTSQAIEALTLHRLSQDEAREKALSVASRRKVSREDARPTWVETGLVFTNGRGRLLESQNVTKRSFKPLLEKAGLPHMRFHELRHSCATNLLAAGVPTKVVSEMLGHAGIAITLSLYAHVLPAHQDAAVKVMEGILTGAAADS